MLMSEKIFLYTLKLYVMAYITTKFRSSSFSQSEVSCPTQKQNAKFQPRIQLIDSLLHHTEMKHWFRSVLQGGCSGDITHGRISCQLESLRLKVRRFTKKSLHHHCFPIDFVKLFRIVLKLALKLTLTPGHIPTMSLSQDHQVPPFLSTIGNSCFIV